MAPARLFLTGYRGTGKSTVGRIVADRLGLSAVDSDDAIEAAAGMPIAEIFADRGEPAFRDLEERVVAGLCERDNLVVALGGGAVLRESTRERLTASGPIVWLTASAETLAARLAADAASETRRPALTGLAPAEEVRAMLEQRTPLYEECATFAVDTEDRPPEEVAAAIIDRLTAT